MGESTSRQRVPASRISLIAAAVLSVALITAVVTFTMRVVAPARAEQAAGVPSPFSPQYTRRLVLVIVDGLRYDVATDSTLMPFFSAAMRERAGGEVWAGQVSMTSSAVLSLGTGQRGRLEQVVRNLEATPPPFNSWIENAKQGGLRVGVVGEPAWSRMYGRHLWAHRDDPEGVAIDVDFNPLTFRAARELIALSPDALVLHFVTPDHQGHAFGIRSQKYRDHIHRFDADLNHLLGELPETWTVIVTSDHGAADSGTHGSDTPLQRRSPLYAYGPGIRSGEKLAHPAEQPDLAATIPVLLGIAPPANGLGHVLSSLIDADPPSRARIAGENARRVIEYASHVVGPAALGEARAALESVEPFGAEGERVAAAERAIRIADRAVARATGLAAPDTPFWMAAIALLALGILHALLPRVPLRAALLGLALAGITTLLVLHVERLPSIWPNGVRLPLFVLTNAVLVGLLAWPSRTAAFLERNPALLVALAPCVLAVSYPASTRPEAFAVVAVLGGVFVGRGALRPELGLPSLRGFALPKPEVGLFVLSLIALSPTVLRESDSYTSILTNEHTRTFLAAGFTSVCFGWLASSTGASLDRCVVAALVGACPVFLHLHVGPGLGRSLWLGFAGLFVFFMMTRHIVAAVIAGSIAVLWVSREFEAFPLLGTVVAATVIARRLEPSASQTRPFPLTNLLLLVTAQFAMSFVFRVGVQNGVDFGGMYWGAGGFNDPNIAVPVVGAALVFKYLMGPLLIGLALRPALSDGLEGTFARLTALVFVLRTLSLCGQLAFAGASYWTAMRVLGDLPTAVAMVVGSLVLVGFEYHWARAVTRPVAVELTSEPAS